jgi:tRNA dimethylallyltransferase
MASAGAGEEAARALEAGASRTARAAVGFDEFLEGDIEGAATRHRQFARRQMTWMRRMEGVTVLPREGRNDGELARWILSEADRMSHQNATVRTSG